MQRMKWIIEGVPTWMDVDSERSIDVLYHPLWWTPFGNSSQADNNDKLFTFIIRIFCIFLHRYHNWFVPMCSLLSGPDCFMNCSLS